MLTNITFGCSGKSEVIKAIIDMAHSWNLQHHVKICATTDRAAALLGGMTVHELLHLACKLDSLDRYENELQDIALIIE